MKKQTRERLIISVIIVQVLFFATWYLMEAKIFTKPLAIIKVKTVSYDPRDLLSGQYITLRYEFRNLYTWDNRKRTKHKWAKNISSKNEIVWIVLENKQDSYYYPVNAFENKPESLAKNQVVIKGQKRKKYRWSSYYYGIERFYVPEGTKNPKRGERFAVELEIYSNGQARVSQLTLIPNNE